MDLSLDDDSFTGVDPLETAERAMMEDDRFQVERGEDGDVQFSFTGNWREAAGYFSYRPELPAVLFTVGFDLRAPMDRIEDASRLAALINENLWLGHFDVWSDDGAIIFRHSAPMIGRDELSMGEAQCMMAAALDAADRFAPAFDFLISGGRTPEEAARAALYEVIGEA